GTTRQHTHQEAGIVHTEQDSKKSNKQGNDQSKLLMKLQVDSKASVAASSFYVTSLQPVLSGGPSRHELHS
ncbi:unnamed protein product, partial [Brassica napus]